MFKDILQKETDVNFLKGKEFYKNSRQSYWILKKVKIFSCLFSIYKSFQVNWVYQ